MTHWQFGLIVGTTLVLTGCGQQRATLQERMLPQSNPTNYEFDASVTDVKESLRNAYDDEWLMKEAKKNRERVWTGNGDARDKRLLTIALQLPPGSLFWKGDADTLSKGL